jgi:hypothetical protein
MFDLVHFVITRAALVGRTTPERALQQLCGRGSAGQRHLQDVGEDPDSAAEFVLRYLDGAPILGEKVMTFRKCVQLLVNTRGGR